MAVKRKCERLARLFSGAEKVFACGSLASAIHAQTACASVDGLEEAERGFALGLLARLDVGDDDAPGARESMALSAIEPAPKVLARKQGDGSDDDPLLSFALGHGSGEHGLAVAGAGQPHGPFPFDEPVDSPRNGDRGHLQLIGYVADARSGSPTSPRR